VLNIFPHALTSNIIPLVARFRDAMLLTRFPDALLLPTSANSDCALASLSSLIFMCLPLPVLNKPLPVPAFELILSVTILPFGALQVDESLVVRFSDDELLLHTSAKSDCAIASLSSLTFIRFPWPVEKKASPQFSRFSFALRTVPGSNCEDFGFAPSKVPFPTARPKLFADDRASRGAAQSIWSLNFAHFALLGPAFS
jgi:hypothetical protein